MDKKSVIETFMQDLDALAKYVQSHLKKPGVSTHTVADKAGGGLSHGTVWNIANRQVNEVKGSTLAALARGLGVSLEEVQGVAQGKPIEHKDPFESLKILFHGWEGATEEDRRDVMAALRLIGEGFQQRLRNMPRMGGGKHRPQTVKPGVVHQRADRKAK